MIDSKELQALISLLDDSDEEVIGMVEQKIYSLGEEALPELEASFEDDNTSELQKLKLEHIIDNIQFDYLVKALKNWADNNSDDLLEGAWLVNSFRYPEIKRQELEQRIEALRLDAWLEFHYDLTSLEKVRILNYILFQLHGFKGEEQNYNNPELSFMSSVLDNKTGNPISLAVIYMLIAQRLHIPIFGVNLPQHFVLAYVDDDEYNVSGLAFNKEEPMDTEGKNVLFYINPFNKGAVFNRQNIEQFIKELRLEPSDEFFLPCSNTEIVKRMLRNLINAYTHINMTRKVEKLNRLLEALG